MLICICMYMCAYVCVQCVNVGIHVYVICMYVCVCIHVEVRGQLVRAGSLLSTCGS